MGQYAETIDAGGIHYVVQRQRQISGTGKGPITGTDWCGTE
jgi:hypothetical protein